MAASGLCTGALQEFAVPSAGHSIHLNRRLGGLGLACLMWVSRDPREDRPQDVSLAVTPCCGIPAEVSHWARACCLPHQGLPSLLSLDSP